MTIDFSLETMEARRKGSEIFKMVKEKKKNQTTQPQNYWTLKISFKYKDVIKTFSDK